MTTSEEVYHHIRRVALAHGWVTPEQDNAYMWEVAVVLWLGEHREGLTTVGALPDADVIRTAISECDQLALYGPKRIPVQKIVWAALEYEYVRKRFIQEYKEIRYHTRPALEAIARENEVPFDEKMSNEDLCEAIAEKIAPLQQVTRECQALSIQIDKDGLIPTQDLPGEMSK
jgi:hypothetical protein